ncbi:hypothetical protein PIB30_081445 [Stylosanthes scabra]|uniref:Uncharacterized protein n=1 Tax=Stylosanthes scabra TaxID=79078 RepID=A0ABU6TR80_9FABA|nr:hypothetical protein [Stylosanthes scabra]
MRQQCTHKEGEHEATTNQRPCTFKDEELEATTLSSSPFPTKGEAHHHWYGHHAARDAVTLAKDTVELRQLLSPLLLVQDAPPLHQTRATNIQEDEIQRPCDCKRGRNKKM